jgi:hypothetical protein
MKAWKVEFGNIYEGPEENESEFYFKEEDALSAALNAVDKAYGGSYELVSKRSWRGGRSRQYYISVYEIEIKE